MSKYLTLSDIAFGVTFLMGLGAFLLFGCIIVSCLIVGGIAYKIQNGWSLREAVRRELKEWL